MSTGNFWEDHGLGQKIVEVLADVSYADPHHHFGKPFVTAYQLAILFKERFPEDFRCFGRPVGGKDSGAQFSLASYLAGQLSRKIKRGEITNVEGSFLSNQQLKLVEFNDGGDIVTSSATDSQYDLSMFRLRVTECSGSNRA